MSVDVITFGCRLNTYESEVIRRQARAADLPETVVFNTCAVTAEAVRQSRQAIRRLKRERPAARIVVTGCAAQTEPGRFADMPEVALVLGNEEKLSAQAWRAHRDVLARAPFGIAAEEKVAVNDIMMVTQTATHLIDGVEGHARAFVQVQNGCDHRCTFCIIPYGRGNSRSVPMGEVVAQVRTLCARGYREVVLTGVDLTSYGANLPGAPRLGTLVKQILKHVPELERLRLSSIDSVEADPGLLDAFASDERLMPHLHLSLQSGDDLILKRMKRRHLRADAIAFCRQVRRLRPDVVFGGDIIAGFPTETEDMFARSLDLVEECGLTHLACLSVLAPAGDAGRAYAPACIRHRQGSRAPAARKRRGGDAPSSRCAGGPHAQGADRIQRHRPHRAFHAGATRCVGHARHDSRLHLRRAQRTATARGVERDVVSITGTIGTTTMTAMTVSPDHLVTSMDALERLYDEPFGPSLVKETDRITGPYRAFIEAAPFFALASGGPDGFDCSPRGDAPGFVRVADEKTLLIPDRRGNNRIDTLRNIIHDPRVALLFLIPGCGETIRVNGRATISTDPALTQSFVIDGKAPRTVIVVTVDRIYYQCAKAIVRSKLWDASRHVERKSLPSAGTILADLTQGKMGGPEHDRTAPERLKATLY